MTRVLEALEVKGGDTMLDVGVNETVNLTTYPLPATSVNLTLKVMEQANNSFYKTPEDRPQNYNDWCQKAPYFSGESVKSCS